MLNKVFKYIETEELADTLKFSADEEDAGYRFGGKGSTTIGTPDILWENIAFIQDKKIIWTHGEFYCQTQDLSYYLLISDYEEDINAIDEALSYAISEHEKDIQAIDEAVSYAISKHEKDINDIDEAVSYAISDHEDKINALTDDIDYLMDVIENIGGSIDLSSYVTKSELSEQSYLTEIPNTYATYAAITAMGYLTSQDISGLATESYVITKVADLVNSAPETLNTLNELAAALGNDENFSTTVATQIGEKVSKTELSGLGYITYTQLSAQGYLTSVPNTYPTYTAIEAMGYATYSYVQSAYAYILNIINEDELVTSTALNDHNTRISTLENAGYAGYAYVYAAYTYILDKLQNADINIDLSSYAGYSYVYSAYSYLIDAIVDNELIFAHATSSLNTRLSTLENANYLTEIPNTYATYAAIESMGYITMQDISAQSYLTEIPSTYATYAAIESMGYLTSQDISGLATETYVTTKVADLVDSAPSTLNTLNELATALGNDENFATTVATQIGEKVSKTELEGLGYITYTQLSAQGYLTSVPNTYPTYTAIEAMGYVTQTSLSENSYAGYSYVYSAYAYILDKLQNVNTNVNIDLSSYAGYSYVYSAYAYILNIINEDELVTSTALNDHNTRINETYSYVQSAYAYLLNEIYDNEYVTAYGLIQLNERIETLEENVGDIDFDQYALKTTLNSYVTYNNAKKWYPSYSYVETYYTTYTYLETRLSTIDLSTYVSKSELTTQSYVTKAELSSQSYLTAVPNTYPTYAAISDMGYVTQTSLSANSYAGYAYVYAAYTYIINSIVDNELVVAQTVLDLNNRVIVLESAGYVTNTQLSNQGYITQIALSNNSYAGYTYVYDSYAYVMSKINTLELATGGGGSGTVAQDGITAISFNGTAASITGSVATIVAPINDPAVQIQIDNATYSFTLNQATGYTINLGSVIRSHQDLSTYVSKTELSGQSYVVSSTLNNYVSKTELSSAGYITSGLPNVTSSDNGKILMVVNGAWTLVSPSTLYSGNATPSNSNGNNGDIYIQS